MKLNKVTEEILKEITDWNGIFDGAYSLREDGECVSYQNSDHIRIVKKSDKPGIDIYISNAAKDETVYIPACVTKSKVNDLVYNDFHLQEGARVTIVAGCGVHTDSDEASGHSGVHRFFLEKNSHCVYKEKHIGIGEGAGKRSIDPVTEIELFEGAYLEMETIQLRGVDTSVRKTSAVLHNDAKLIIHESLLTDAGETATTDFVVDMLGDDSSVDIVSRSVAKGDSYQEYTSKINGRARCTGHSECDAILVDNGKVNASPALFAANLDAALIHEAAIGKIAGEQIIKLETLGLSEEEAQNRIIAGFLGSKETLKAEVKSKP